MSDTVKSIYEFAEDLASAEAPIPLPAGEYRAEVRHIIGKTSKSSGNPMAEVQYVISQEQFPVDFTDGNPDGELLTVYVSLVDTPRNRYSLRKFHEMHGVAPSRKMNLPDFLGQAVIMRVEHEEFQGVMRARGTPVRAV